MISLSCILLAGLLQFFDSSEHTRFFTSREAQAAQTEYCKFIPALNIHQNEEWKHLVQVLCKDLFGVRKKALEASDLDEAERTDKIVKQLERIQARGVIPYSIISAKWSTIDQQVDVTERVRELLTNEQPLGLDSSTLQIKNPSGNIEKTLYLTISPRFSVLTLPGEKPGSEAARKAFSKYESAAIDLYRQGITEWKRVRSKYIGTLTEVQKKSLISNKLDEATALAIEIKSLEETSSNLPVRIRVLSAEWGAGRRKVDVVTRVRQLFRAGELVRADEATLQVPDPAYGSVKTLTIQLEVENILTTVVAPDFHGIQIAVGRGVP